MGRDPRSRSRRRRKAADQEAVPAPPVVGPGLAGGAYRPLSESEIERIHRTALAVLQDVGVADPLPEMLDRAMESGAWLNEHQRLCFSPAFVEDVIAAAPGEFTIYARDPAYDIHLGGSRVSYSTAGQAVSIYEASKNRYRPSTLLDLYDLARLVDRLDHIHRFCQPVVATDIPDPAANSANIAYAMLAGTRKSFSCTIVDPADIAAAVAMFDIALGEEGAFRKKPFATIGACPIVSPLRFGADGCRVAIASTRLGIPCDFAIAPQAGATSPAALAGTLVQVTAETLASLILTHLFAPGHPTVYAAWPLVSDLRTGAFSGGGGEQALLAAAAVQIGNFYNLPTSVGAGMSDSKVPDAQAGFEKALSTALAGHAGANYVGEAAGMQASLLGCSFEAMVIDNEMLGAVQRTIRGIEVNDETLSFEVIRSAALGEGHFLGTEQTLALMKTEFLYPSLADRKAPNAWAADGGEDILAAARSRVREILAGHYPNYLDPEVDAAIRRIFPIELPPGAMRPGSRW